MSSIAAPIALPRRAAGGLAAAEALRRERDAAGFGVGEGGFGRRQAGGHRPPYAKPAPVAPAAQSAATSGAGGDHALGDGPAALPCLSRIAAEQRVDLVGARPAC